MRKTLHLLALACCFCLVQCKKNKNTIPPDNPYGLPNATQEGRNIFACRVNGENWISSRSIYDLGGGVNGDTTRVNGSNPATTSHYERFDISITEVIQNVFTYNLNDTVNQFARFSSNNGCFSGGGGFGTGRGKSYEGEVTFLKIDTTKKIVAGKFWFSIETDYCDTLKITDGRFDIRYR